MKQLIVMISTIILGIAIAGMVLSFKTQAQTLTDKTGASISNVINEIVAPQ